MKALISVFIIVKNMYTYVVCLMFLMSQQLSKPSF